MLTSNNQETLFVAYLIREFCKVLIYAVARVFLKSFWDLLFAAEPASTKTHKNLERTTSSHRRRSLGGVPVDDGEGGGLAAGVALVDVAHDGPAGHGGVMGRRGAAGGEGCRGDGGTGNQILLC